MNRDEAKFILQACRPNGQDAADPHFAEALAMVKSDPELVAWFAEQQKFDRLISGGLNQMRPPVGLKAEILALEKKAAAQTGLQSKKAEAPDGPPFSVCWRNLFSWPVTVAWATALVFLLSLVIFWKKTPAATFQDFSAQMVSTALNDPHHADAAADDLKSALVWLGEHHGENNLVLPAALDGSGPMGCRVLTWHGQTVSMLCYHTSGSGHMDLFVADAKIFSDAPPVDQPRFASNDKMPTASWSHDGKVYLLVGHDETTDLKKLFSPGATAEIKLRPELHSSFL